MLTRYVIQIDNFVSVLAGKRHKTSNSRENLDENGCFNPNINQLHGAAGQARTVGHRWRCEFCLRKWRLQLISASKWEIVTNVFLLRNPSFHTGVQAKYAYLWTPEREGGVNWSVHLTLSGLSLPCASYDELAALRPGNVSFIKQKWPVSRQQSRNRIERAIFPPPWTL